MKRFIIFIVCILFFLSALSLFAQTLAPSPEPKYPERTLTGGFAYNQYADGTLPVQIFLSIQQQIKGPLYSYSTVDLTATPVDSPDGKFKMPTLQLSPRTGVLLYVHKFGNLQTFLLGDAGLAFTNESTLGSFTGGGGGAYQIKKKWAIPAIFRAIGRTSLETKYIFETGITYIP